MASTGYMQLAIEQAPNAEAGANAVSSNVFYIPAQSIKPDPKVGLLDVGDELAGYAAEPPHLGVAEYAPEHGFKTRIRPGYLGQLLILATSGTQVTTAGNAVITDPSSVAVPIGAYRHVMAWATGATPKTCQATYAPPAGLFYRHKGLGIDSIEFAAADGVWWADVACKGLHWAIISDPSLTAAIETPKPFLDGDMTLTWLAGSAVTKDFTLKIENGLETDRQFTTASQFPDRIRIATPYQRLIGMIPKEAMDADDWAALTAGTAFAATIKLTHRETIKRVPVAVTSSSVAAASVITCGAAHNLPAGTSTVVIAGHSGSTPDINGTHVATKIDATTFSIPVTVSIGGTGGTEISDTAYKHQLWVELPACQYMEPTIDEIKNDRRHEASFAWAARYDTTTSKWATVTLVNATSAYETY